MPSFLERWKEEGLIAAVKGGDDGVGQNPTQVVPQAQQVIPTNFAQSTLSPVSTASLAEATKQAFVEEAAQKVPDLKKLLESAALIVDDVPDLQKRLNITAKQLRASGQFNAQQALAGMKQSVASMSQALLDEVKQEETQSITGPTQEMQRLEAARQELIQQAETLAEQAGTLRLRITTAQETVARSKAKCDAGIAFMQSWQSQMEQLLSNLK
jgi:hypothetical protein